MWFRSKPVPPQKCSKVRWWAQRAVCKKGREWTFGEREGEQKPKIERVGERLRFVFIAPPYDKRFAASEAAVSECGVGGWVDGVVREETADQLRGL